MSDAHLWQKEPRVSKEDWQSIINEMNVEKDNYMAWFLLQQAKEIEGLQDLQDPTLHCLNGTETNQLHNNSRDTSTKTLSGACTLVTFTHLNGTPLQP